MKDEIGAFGQCMVEHEITADAHQDGDDEQAEDSLPLLKIMRPQVDNFLFSKIWVNEPGDQVEQDRLREKHGKLVELPVMPVAHVEQGPPGLRANEQKRRSPNLRGPVRLHSRVRKHPRAQALQDLRNRQPQDDREKDGKITELIHALDSARPALAQAIRSGRCRTAAFTGSKARLSALMRRAQNVGLISPAL